MTTEPNVPSTPEVPLASPQAIEQYKAKLSDLGNLGARQTSMTTYYVTIVSALIGLLALKERSLFEMEATALFMVCGAGLMICLLWFSSLNFFRSLFRAKLKVLEDIEEALPYQTFRKEFEAMRQSKFSRWLWIERFVPVVFGLFFMSVAGLKAAKILACIHQ